jgi:hypothetical protein
MRRVGNINGEVTFVADRSLEINKSTFRDGNLALNV